MHAHRTSAGFTLVEVMIVLVVMAILAAAIVPAMNPNLYDQLETAAQLIASDLAYGRGLAVTNNSTYRYTFDVTNNLYYLEYSGTNSALSTLPSSAFYTSQDTSTRRYMLLNNLPGYGGVVRLAAVGSNGSSPAPLTQLEFGSFGQTTQTDETDIWLTAGSGSLQRYMYVKVNPITGLATVEAFLSTGPPAAILSGS
jgi:prepilin-type N-terminal cleavage/methylation domain-containing protein